MRAVAAIPAIGLLAGCGFGLLAPDIPPLIEYVALAVCACGALRAWRLSQPWTLACAVGFAFFWGGTLLSADAWHDAWRPSLRVTFESLVRAERAEVTGVDERVSADSGALAILTGVLRADASPRQNGVSISLDVRSIRGLKVRSAARSGPRSDGVPSGGIERHDLPVTGDIPVRGGVLLMVLGELASQRANQWRAGRTVRVPAQLRRPARYLNPGVPDEERSLARRGTALVGTVKSGALVEVVATGGRLAEAAAAIRSFARRAIAASVGRWNPRSAAVVTAIVIGDRAGLDEEVQRRLQEAGTYHVIAISGGNIAILAGLMLAAFRFAGVLGRAAAVSAIGGLIAYWQLVGGGPSVERATLMAVVYFTGRAIDLRGPPVNALALVAALVVATQPLSVADAGFLLTFGATAAILLIVLAMPLRSLPRLIAPVAALLAASVAVEAALLPIAAYVFSRVTFAGLVLNFAAIPLMAVAQIGGMALLPAAFVSPTAASGIGFIAHLGAEGLVDSANLVELVPALTWRVGRPHWIAMAAYYAGLVLGWTLWRRRTEILTSSEADVALRIRYGAAGIAVAAAIWIVAEPQHFLTRRGDGRLHVAFIDVGQGDAAFLRLPNGASLLVDAGGLTSGSFDIGDRVVAPVLRGAGVRRLDSVALTHADADHTAGALSIMREFRPRDVWEGIPVPRLEPLRLLRAAATGAGARWVNVQTNDLVTIGDVQMFVRHPRIADWERQEVRNDDSIVLELLWRDVSVVLTGDIGREVEQAIAPLFPAVPLRIVKVPHHGSLTSSTSDFVRALAPAIAVVSAGRGNPFGHPAPEVLERYRRTGAEVFRTDRDGAVFVDTDGHSIDVRTFTGRTHSVP